MSQLRVLVVGASIAGPMAAYWFARAGARVTVIERFPQLRTGGQNIDIRLTGVTVMRKIPGMEKAVRASLAPLVGMGLIRDDGSLIAVMKGTGNAEQQSLMSEFEIYRGDLSRILYDLTKDHERVKYIFDEQVASIRQEKQDDSDSTNDGPVQVEFANGTPTAEYDLVVACDGATSRTRSIGLGCGARDYINPVGVWTAYFSIKKDILNGSKIAKALSLPGGCFVGAAPDPSSGTNRITVMSAHPAGDDSDLQAFRAAQKQSTDHVKQLVAQRIKSSEWHTADILAGMAESTDFYAAEMCQVKTPHLHNSRNHFVLVGDAGYAAGPTGTGTSLAMAGAYVLAGEIARHKDKSTNTFDIAAGLQAYESRMRPIIDDMQVIPPGVVSFMAPQTVWGIWLRNLMFTIVCWGMNFSGEFFGWLTSLWGAGFGKDKYNLPEYEWVE